MWNLFINSLPFAFTQFIELQPTIKYLHNLQHQYGILEVFSTFRQHICAQYIIIMTYYYADGEGDYVLLCINKENNKHYLYPR